MRRGIILTLLLVHPLHCYFIYHSIIPHASSSWKEPLQAVCWTEQTKEFVYIGGSEEGKEETPE